MTAAERRERSKRKERKAAIVGSGSAGLESLQRRNVRKSRSFKPRLATRAVASLKPEKVPARMVAVPLPATSYTLNQYKKTRNVLRFH